MRVKATVTDFHVEVLDNNNNVVASVTYKEYTGELDVVALIDAGVALFKQAKRAESQLSGL